MGSEVFRKREQILYDEPTTVKQNYVQFKVTGALKKFHVYAHLGHIFYRQLDFSSQPGGSNEILEKESRSC